MLLLLFLSDGLGLKGINMLMLCHVNENFAAGLNVFGLHYESFLRLYDSATFGVNVRFAIRGTLGCLLCRHLIKHLLHLRGAISRSHVFINLHQLGVTI